jgi:hypothetical protein
MEPYKHTDGRILKLGKRPARVDPRTLQLKDYLEPDISPAPASMDWSKGTTSWGMMLNDSLGDCTIAACGHAVQLVSLNTTAIITEPDAEIEKYYEWWCGYVPGDPNTDQGGVELDILNSWRKNGFAGHKLLGYVDPSPGDAEHVKQSVALFGMVYIGLGLPLTAQNQVGSLWDVVGNPATDANSQPGSWGGHAVIVIAYDADTLTVVTWGALQKMSWRFWNAYVDESHTPLLGYWLENGPAPSGFRMTALETDLAKLSS